MLKLYFHPSPNPLKVALFLEETGLPYEVVPVDTRKGEQFSPEFLAINPNAKTPAIVDGDVAVFDSNAILLYLAEKTGQLTPKDAAARGEMFSWLMFVATGIGPYSGQAVHFSHYAPAGSEYAINRYSREIERHYRVLDARLASRAYILGDDYSVVDICAWGWVRVAPFVLGERGFDAYPNVKRWFDLVNARPAVTRAMAIKDRFTFKAEMDDAARSHMFPQNATLAAE